MLLAHQQMELEPKLSLGCTPALPYTHSYKYYPCPGWPTMLCRCWSSSTCSNWRDPFSTPCIHSFSTIRYCKPWIVLLLQVPVRLVFSKHWSWIKHPLLSPLLRSMFFNNWDFLLLKLYLSNGLATTFQRSGSYSFCREKDEAHECCWTLYTM